MNTVLMLEAIEKACGKPLNELFDLVCGTSIGSCIAAGITMGTSLDLLMQRLEALCYAGTDTCGPVFPSKSTWRLLTKGYRIGGPCITKFMDSFTDALGVGCGEAILPPGRMNVAGNKIPHYFSVTTQEQLQDHWLPFVVSNYKRDAGHFTVAGTSGWPLHT
jgi:hypothetical protein